MYDLCNLLKIPVTGGKISRRITGFTYVSLVKFSHGYSLSMHVTVLIIKAKSRAGKCALTLNKNFQN